MSSDDAADAAGLAPGKTRISCDEATKTSFEEHGSRGLLPDSRLIVWCNPNVRLRRDIGRIRARKDLDARPGFKLALMMAKQIESIGDVVMADLTSDIDRVNEVSKDLSLSDFIYLQTWRAWERFGEAWQYPYSFTCQSCEELIDGAEVDLSQVAVYRPTGADGSITYRLRHPWRRLADEVVVEVVIGRDSFKETIVNCSQIEWDEDDDFAIRVRQVASGIVSMVVSADGAEKVVVPKIISHRSLDNMHEVDLESMSRIVRHLGLGGGTGERLTYTHKMCGGESHLAMNWRTDFLGSSGA